MSMSITSGSTRSSVQSQSSVSSEARLSALDDVNWYHSNIDRHIAETLLLNNAREGSFLLRDKSNGNQGYDFVLSVRAKDAVNHYECKWDGKNYCFGFGSFKGLQEFHDHLMTQTLLAGENGVLTVLKHPYPRDVQEPSIYDTIRIHASMGRNKSIVNQPNLSIGTKEGFLTKQGGRVKNWKTRWFTVQSAQMKYFKDRSDKDPIRTLDLHDCSEVKMDKTFKDRDHCFSVKFSWRTFYFCASTHQEAKEWVELLQWKLNSFKGSKDTDQRV